jgi:transposase
LSRHGNGGFTHAGGDEKVLTLPANVRLFLAADPADFRKSFDGLSAIVEGEFGMTMSSGHVFVFLNKRATQVKLLFWDRDGLCLVAKRLEAGTFRRIRREGAATPHFEIDAAELVFLLEGIEVQSMRRRKRYVGDWKIVKKEQEALVA